MKVVITVLKRARVAVDGALKMNPSLDKEFDYSSSSIHNEAYETECFIDSHSAVDFAEEVKKHFMAVELDNKFYKISVEFMEEV